MRKGIHLDKTAISGQYYRIPTPFRDGLRVIKNETIWNASSASWHSRRNIRKLKGLHRGDKAVICCNGPSLNKVDFDLLNGKFCFGLNKIHLLFDRTDWRPSAIVAVNPLVIEQTSEIYRQTTLPVFLGKSGIPLVGCLRHVAYLHSSGSQYFSLDPSISIWEGFTVTFVALQLAYYMGFSSVALVGCDHSFADKGAAGSLVKTKEQDNNHFSPDYFGKNVQWHLPDLEGSEFAYRLARDAFQADGRTVYNCTEGGFLEVFERISLECFLDPSVL